MGLLSPLYTSLDVIFAPFFSLTPEVRTSMMLGIFFISLLVSFITTLATAKVVDQDEMKKIKKKINDFKEKISEARKAGDEKRVTKLTEKMTKLSLEQSKNAFKPMIYTMAPILLVFRWQGQYGPLQTFIIDNGNFLVSLPFSLPKFGTELGWLGWYIICSFMTSTVIRKMFKIQM